MDGSSWVNIIEKAWNIKEKEGARMSCGSRALDLMDQGGHGVDGAVMGSGSELGHWKEVKALDIHIDAFGDDFL
jgi:hypothetical protein